jgi:hypothetical protein
VNLFNHSQCYAALVSTTLEHISGAATYYRSCTIYACHIKIYSSVYRSKLQLKQKEIKFTALTVAIAFLWFTVFIFYWSIF